MPMGKDVKWLLKKEEDLFLIVYSKYSYRVIVTDKIQMFHPSLKNGPSKASNCLAVRTAADS